MGVILSPAHNVELLAPDLPIACADGRRSSLAELRGQLGLHYRIEVDGGVAHDTVAAIVQAGADLLVAGSAVFGGGHPERDARGLLAAAREAADQVDRPE